ncbi:protein kinase [Aspergillus novofumigatus IBT 16806]|uniref:Protein kinase n=1 Tax=Aspergillus novofumigatus (strain IBT 16806) TaxID=1392255 RepID=A0A2I1C406_ASPN1|nr:protein kinase [Aspergillus novofumigatus IBT 16806]PKX92345.1 protein kinase [Aspergillus novofumigatus IBT 16806]
MGILAAAPQYTKGDNTADFGDFASNEDEKLDLEDVVEPWHKYDVKETSRNTKIGSGGFFTVWMARDLHDKKDVALKVMSSGEWGETEIRMQDKIIQNIQDTCLLVMYSATFPLPGNNFYHRVLVFPLPLPCYPDKYAHGAARMSAARQPLEALESLHKAGIVHRDLNERNCMFGMVPLHNLDRSAKYDAPGRPLKRIIPYVELWKQGELVRPIEDPDNLRTEKFYFSDFGLAMHLGDLVTPRGYLPMQFCSPDRLHKEDSSFACDMWSYMIIFAELYLGYTPSPTHLKGGLISGIVRCLGPLPESWKGLYTHPGGFDSWYDQGITPDPKHDLASTIAYWRPDADPIERELVPSIMNRVFTYSQDECLTATQLLQDPSSEPLWTNMVVDVIFLTSFI